MGISTSSSLPTVYRGEPEKEGFVSRRTSGDHIIMTKRGTVRPLVIQKKDQVPISHIMGLLRTAGMSRDRYFQLLAEC